MKTGVLAAAVVCSLAVALPGGAVTGGTAVAPAPSWAAYIVVKHNRSTSVCSGALVGSSWILTAAQCVAPTKKSPCKFLSPYPAGSFTVYLGRTSPKHKGQAYRVSSVAMDHPSSTKADRQCVLRNDVALLHLSKATTRSPLWIAPSHAAVTPGTQTVLYGYGIENPTKKKSYGWLNSTIKGKWTVDTTCDLASKIHATCVDRNRKGGPAGSTGDSGGPWTMTVDGNPVAALVFTGYDALHGFAYGTGVGQASASAWLHSKLGIPNVAPGKIVEDTVSGNSWLIDTQGYRRPIPNAGTYSCLTGKGAEVVDLPAAAIQRMAARTIAPTCVSGADVLIAGAGDGGWTSPNDNLAALFTSAGYQVTESATLPSDLSAFGQVWWIDTNAPSSAEQDQLVAFEAGGGGVFLTGELTSCCDLLNAADTAMINSVVVGGGVTAGGQGTVATSSIDMPVNSSVVGGLSQQPFAIDHWTPSQPGGMAGVPATSVFSYYQPGDITTRKVVAAAWDRASLVGHGRLVVFMDVNWDETGFQAANWSDVAQNVAFFLSGLTDPPGTPVTSGASIFASSPLAVPGLWTRPTAP
jgi:Trypsin